MSNPKKWGDTISKAGEISRVFCGNIDPATFVCADLEGKFNKYGKINGIDINKNGFAFIQFDQVDDAQRAVAGENKKVLKNRTLEVRMFGKSKKKRGRSQSPQNNKGGPMNNKFQRANNQPRRFFNNNQQRDSPIMQQPLLNVNTANDLLPHPHHLPQPSPSLLMGSTMMDSNQFNNYPNLANNPMNQPMNQGMNPMNAPMNQMNNQPPDFNSDFNKPPAVANSLGNNQLTLSNPNQAPLGNELEIIVMNKAQLKYCEMLERRFRKETCLRFIDLVFPHSPEMVAITMKDLYEKKTLYAVVVDAMNEQTNTFNLHILHNQTEYANVSIIQGIQLICQDFIKEIANPHGGYYRQKSSSSSNAPSSALNPVTNVPTNQPVSNYGASSFNQIKSAGGANHEMNKLPNNIAYVLKSTLDDNSAEFLSIVQIDSVIEYYSNVKERLLARSSLKQQGPTDHYQANNNNNSMNRAGVDVRQSNNSSTLDSSQLNLDSEQIKKALNSLMNLSSLNSNDGNPHHLANAPNDGLTNTNNYVSSSMNNYSNYGNNLNNNNNDRPPMHHQMNQMGGGDQLLPGNYMNNNNNNSFSRQPQQQQPNFMGQREQPMFRTTKMNEFNEFNQPPPQQFRGPRQSRFN